MADTKITDLTDLPVPVGADLFVMVDDVAGTPTTKKATLTNVEAVLDHDNLVNTHNLTTDIDHDQLTNYAANEHFTQASITTVGTIASGVWQGTAIDGAYVDIEGTEIKSTGEAGGTKFLREDGDGTCSWQSPAGGGDALTTDPLSQFAATTSLQLLGVMSDETGTGSLVFATSPTLVTPLLGTPTSGTLTNCTGYPSSAIDHDSTTNFVANEHIDWTSTSSNFSTSGTVGTGALTFTTATGTGDNSSADTAYVPMVLYNTDATPPAASGFPIGTLYVQYTA